MSEPKDESYSPEPGSSLHRMVETEELGRVEDEETKEQRTQEKLDREDYKEMTSREQEFKELRIDWTHADRVKDGQVAEGYAEKSSGEIENEAYHFWLQKFRKGDKRPTAKIYSDFYKAVYPQYGPYLEQKRQVNPELRVENVLDDFLQGADLRGSK